MPLNNYESQQTEPDKPKRKRRMKGGEPNEEERNEDGQGREEVLND